MNESLDAERLHDGLRWLRLDLLHLAEMSKSTQHKHQIGTLKDLEGSSSIDGMPCSPTKASMDDENDSRKRDLGTLCSSLSFMQAASAQSLNNNLLQENPNSAAMSSTVSPHEYLARYYHIMQQHQQQAAAAAAAINGSTAMPTRHHNQL